MNLLAVAASSVFEEAQKTKLDRRSRRQRIFEKGDSMADLDVKTLLHGDYIDEVTRKNLMDALSWFYFLSGGEKDPKMDLLLRAMQKEEFEEGYLLINEVQMHRIIAALFLILILHVWHYIMAE